MAAFTGWQKWLGQLLMAPSAPPTPASPVAAEVALLPVKLDACVRMVCDQALHEGPCAWRCRKLCAPSAGALPTGQAQTARPGRDCGEAGRARTVSCSAPDCRPMAPPWSVARLPEKRHSLTDTLGGTVSAVAEQLPAAWKLS